MTERTLGVERLFTLGDYKNIKFVDTISNLPAKIWNNSEAVSQLTTLQLVSIELAFRHYQQLVQGIGQLDLEASIAYLEKLKGSRKSVV